MESTKTRERFLLALKAALHGQMLSDEEVDASPQEIMEVLQMAQIHKVLPMVYESMHSLSGMKEIMTGPGRGVRRMVLQVITQQMTKTEEFLKIYESIPDSFGVCVVKGLICRSLYPNPDARVSSDEDLWISPDAIHTIHTYLLSKDMELLRPDTDIDTASEIGYIRKGSPLYLEVHKYLFPTESEAYGDLNMLFDEARDRMEYVEVMGRQILTMRPTDHLLYLICHAFKHFLHSGFGIRQVCDILRFSETYGERIDWKYILDCCQSIRCELFASAMFRIGEKYLAYDSAKACMTKDWLELTVDEEPMLSDLLEAGVFGQSNLDRQHSSNITLQAVVADRRGEKSSNGIMGSIFLPLANMQGTYRYLKKYPFLLPAAWLHRIFRYLTHLGDGRPTESIRIGSERVRLLTEYGIIKRVSSEETK